MAKDAKAKLEFTDGNAVITIPLNDSPVRPVNKKGESLTLAILAKTAWEESQHTVTLEDGRKATIKFMASVGFNPDKPQVGTTYEGVTVNS